MPDIQFKSGELITSVDVLNNVLKYIAPPSRGSYPSFTATIYLVSVTVGIKFASGEETDQDGIISYPFLAGSEVIMGFIPGETDINFKATTIGDQFVVTVSN